MIKTVWCITPYVSDLKRARKFYEEMLGLAKTNTELCWLRVRRGGDRADSKARKRAEGEPLSPSVGFLVIDAERVYDELKQRGRVHKELHEEPWRKTGDLR